MLKDAALIVLSRYTPDFYSIIKEWWLAHNAPVIEPDHLPEYGLLAFDADRPIAAAFLIRTETKFCMIEWGVTDPSYRDKAKRDKAIDCIVNAMRAVAGQLGYRALFTTTNNSRLIKRYDDAGYDRSGERMTNFMIKAV